MKGYRIVFYTQENRTVHHKPIGEWILERARDLGSPGGTATPGGLGFGHAGRIHSAGFFELADRPLVVSVITDERTCERLMKAVAAEQPDIFYSRSEVEFGRLGGDDNTEDLAP